MRKTKDVVAEITLCDADSSGLCIVTFGTDSQNNIIINFQLPNADYPRFYVKASNRGNVNTYPCQIVTAAPTSVYCTGLRTPLGEYLDIEVYTNDEDTLIARGKFVVSALVRTTPVNLDETPSTPDNLTGTPTFEASSTPIPVTGYPNPTAYPNP